MNDLMADFFLKNYIPGTVTTLNDPNFCTIGELKPEEVIDFTFVSSTFYACTSFNTDASSKVTYLSSAC